LPERHRCISSALVADLSEGWVQLVRCFAATERSSQIRGRFSAGLKYDLALPCNECQLGPCTREVIVLMGSPGICLFPAPANLTGNEPMKFRPLHDRVEGSIVVGKVLANKSASYGFDAQKEEYVDVLSAGIVDPHSPLPRGGQKKEHQYPLRCQRRAGSRAGRDRLSVRSFLTRAALIGKKTARECR
jgi:hypothetical protein